MPNSPHPVDAAMAALAVVQDQLFSGSQARAAGANASLVLRRVASGRWVRWGGDVFGVPGLDQSPRRLLRAAMLDRPGSQASHEASAALHRVEGFHLVQPVILVPHGSYHESPFAKVHQTRLWPVPVVVGGFPATPLLRTVLDLSVVVGSVRLGRAIDELVVAKRLTFEQVAAGAEWMRLHRRPGSETLQRSLDGRTTGYVPSRSELERALDAITSTIPGLVLEREVELARRTTEPHRVDRLCRNPPLIVEGDGRLYHARLAAMEKDKRRDRAALQVGYPTARYSWPELVHEAEDVRAELIALTVARRASAA